MEVVSGRAPLVDVVVVVPSLSPLASSPSGDAVASCLSRATSLPMDVSES